MATPRLATHKKCTGCMACQYACKHGAISIQMDSNGFVYPYVNEDNCKECGACSRMCPILNVDKIQFRVPSKCYAAKIKDEELTKGCTSGGIAAGLSRETIRNGGVVYGAAFVPQQGVQHIRIDDESQLKLLKGSKYVESHITSEIYKQIRVDVKSGREVLFIGTPCQVEAIESIFGKDKLKSVSFICGGVPSQDYLYSHLNSYGLKKEKITNVIFRKGRQYCIEAWTGDKVAYYQEEKNDLYLKAFDIQGYIVRPSCLRCEFCKEVRVGTFTIGDFWGIENTECKIKDEGNLSCVVTHDKSGQEIIEGLDHVILEEVSFEEIGRSNVCLHHPRRCKGWKLLESLTRFCYPKLGFNKSVKIVEIIRLIYSIPRKIKTKMAHVIYG